MPRLLNGRQSSVHFSAAGVVFAVVAPTATIYEDAINKLRIYANPIWTVTQSKSVKTTYVIAYDIVTGTYRQSVETHCS